MKIKHKIITTCYPYALRKNEYVNELTEELMLSYTQFTEDEINGTLNIISSIVESVFSDDKTYYNLISNIILMKNLEDEFQIIDNSLPQPILTTLAFLNGKEDVRYYNLAGLNFPEGNKLEYLKLISDATKKSKPIFAQQQNLKYQVL